MDSKNKLITNASGGASASVSDALGNVIASSYIADVSWNSETRVLSCLGASGNVIGSVEIPSRMVFLDGFGGSAPGKPTNYFSSFMDPLVYEFCELKDDEGKTAFHLLGFSGTFCTPMFKFIYAENGYDYITAQGTGTLRDGGDPLNYRDWSWSASNGANTASGFLVLRNPSGTDLKVVRLVGVTATDADTFDTVTFSRASSGDSYRVYFTGDGKDYKLMKGTYTSGSGTQYANYTFSIGTQTSMRWYLFDDAGVLAKYLSGKFASDSASASFTHSTSSGADCWECADESGNTMVMRGSFSYTGTPTYNSLTLGSFSTSTSGNVYYRVRFSTNQCLLSFEHSVNKAASYGPGSFDGTFGSYLSKYVFTTNYCDAWLPDENKRPMLGFDCRTNLPGVTNLYVHMSDLLTPLTVEKLLTYKQTLPYKAYLYDTDGKSYLLVSLTNAAKVGDDPEDPASYTWSVDTSASATLRVYDTDGKSYLELVGTVSGSGTSFSGFTFTSAGTSNGSNVHLENANGDAYENTATITGSGTSFSDFGAASITLQANSGRFIVLSQDKLYAKGICVQNAVLSAVSYDGVTAERRTPASPSSTSDFIEMYKNINRSIVKHIVVVFQGDGDVRSYNNWTADVSLTNLAASGNYMEQSTKNGDYMKLQSAVVSSDGTYSGTTFNVCSNLASNTSKVQRVYSFGVYLVKVSPAYTYNAFLTPDTFKLSWK